MRSGHGRTFPFASRRCSALKNYLIPTDSVGITKFQKKKKNNKKKESFAERTLRCTRLLRCGIGQYIFELKDPGDDLKVQCLPGRTLNFSKLTVFKFFFCRVLVFFVFKLSTPLFSHVDYLSRMTLLSLL